MDSKDLNKLSQQELDFVDDKTAAILLNTPSNARVILWILLLFLVIAVLWANWAVIDKVTVGQGKVIPSSHLQVVQNLEGGVLKKIMVQEGDQVKKGQLLLMIDDTRFLSDYREREQQVANLTASVIQLSASIKSVSVMENINTDNWHDGITVDDNKLSYPADFSKEYPTLVSRQQAKYFQELSDLKNQLTRLDQQVAQKQQDLVELNTRVTYLRESHQFAAKELELTQPLAAEGLVPKVEILKLRRQVNETKSELISTKLKAPVLEAAVREAIFARVDIAQSFLSEQQRELNKAEDQLSALTESAVGLQDRVNRTSIESPVTGTVKKLHVNTLGGVIQPGMDLVEIVPTEDTLLIEANVLPKDIAFLHPGLPAVVKFTAYNFTTYGGLTGKLEHISADTIQDEEGKHFYLVRIRTEQTEFGQHGELPIIPGMTVSVDIITGKRTLLDYLLKPIMRTSSNALKE